MVILKNDSVTGFENFCDLHTTADDVTSTDKVEFLVEMEYKAATTATNSRDLEQNWGLGWGEA